MTVAPSLPSASKRLPGLVLIEPEADSLRVSTRPPARLCLTPRSFREKSAALAYALEIADRHDCMLVDLTMLAAAG